MRSTGTHSAFVGAPSSLYRPDDLGGLFAELATEIARVDDPAAVTSAVDSLIAFALGLGRWDSWASWDSWGGRSATATPTTDPARSFTLFGIRERQPGPRWQALFAATWAAYRAWYLQDGDDARPDLATARAELIRTCRSSCRRGRRWWR